MNIEGLVGKKVKVIVGPWTIHGEVLQRPKPPGGARTLYVKGRIQHMPDGPSFKGEEIRLSPDRIDAIVS